MKLSAGKKVHFDAGPNMTPLVDIVMVILIFLMLTGSFGGLEHYLISSTPPRRGGVGQPADPNHPPPPDDKTLEISVFPVGEDKDGYRTDCGKYHAENDWHKLQADIEREHAQLNAAGIKDSDILVVISPTKEVHHKCLMDVYQAAMNANFTKIAFRTTP